jgi:hypothetical protein
MSSTISKLEITNSCTCYHCSTCDVGWTSGGDCADCGNELQPTTYCDGICWEDSNMTAEYALEEYLKSVDNPNYVRIEGRAMGWQRRSGWKDSKSDWESLRDSLSIDGEYTLRMEIDSAAGIFTVWRYSHDEPTGARFSIYPIKLWRESLSIDDAIQAELVDEYGCHKSCGNYFYDCECVVEND